MIDRETGPPPTPAADCYSDGEREWMVKYQAIRLNLTRPILVRLTALNVTADIVTMLAGVVGLCFVPLWLLNHKILAITCLLVHILLDGLDGTLARYQNLASSRGSFTDTAVDQFVMTCVTITWLITEPSSENIAAASAYIFLYTIVVSLAMVRNAMSVPFAFVVRPRFFVYLAMATDYWFELNSTIYILVIANLLLGISALTGCYVLRQNLPGPEINQS